MNRQKLHDTLAEIAERSRPTDLYDRSLVRSARLRRRQRATAAVGGAVALVLVAVAGWTLVGRPASLPVPPATVPPSPSTSASASASASASPSPSPAPTAPGATQALVDVRDQFANATLPLPSWPNDCPRGPVTLTNSAYATRTDPYGIRVELAYGLSIGGQPGYLVDVSCMGPGQGVVGGLFVYRGSPTDGLTLVTTVLRTVFANAPGPDDITRIQRVVGDGPEGILVTVEQQTVVGTSPPAHAHLAQQRRYAWTGSTYQQIDGATSFVIGPDESTATVTASALVMQAPVNGCRTGTMTITVRNNGPQLAPKVSAVVYFADDQGTDKCRLPAGQDYRSAEVVVDALAPGESRTVTATVAYNDLGNGHPAGTTSGAIELRTGERRYPETTQFAIEYR